MVEPAPMRQLSMLPPWVPGGIELSRPWMLGATPAVPRCGLTGTRMPSSAAYRDYKLMPFEGVLILRVVDKTNVKKQR